MKHSLLILSLLILAISCNKTKPIPSNGCTLEVSMDTVYVSADTNTVFLTTVSQEWLLKYILINKVYTPIDTQLDLTSENYTILANGLEFQRIDANKIQIAISPNDANFTKHISIFLANGECTNTIHVFQEYHK